MQLTGNRVFGALLVVALSMVGAGCSDASRKAPANIVVIFADDMGYGDVGVYGHPTIKTPSLDRLASEGMKFTQFYAAASVCTPSRAGLLTGRLPVRSGMASDKYRVLFPDSEGGLPASEVTIAEALREQGYATAAIGKWHLGHLPQYLPTNHGFDTYFGIPYSNDMDPVNHASKVNVFEDPEIEYWNNPLLRDTVIVERPTDQRTITKRYTEEAISFIETHQDGPFFVYLAHNLPHIPLFRSSAFENVSARGLYGDVIEEIDWSVGQVASALSRLGLAENTLLIFTSDNGPWLVFDTHGGSAGLLRGGKGMTWEGGFREPAIAWWPGTIEPGSVSDAITSTMDIFPTALEIAGVTLPEDRVIDGESLLPIFSGSSSDLHETYFYYRGATLYAIRKGSWKAHFITEWAYTSDNERTVHERPLLFNLDEDPSEKYDIGEDHLDVLSEIQALYDQHRSSTVIPPSQLEARTGRS